MDTVLISVEELASHLNDPAWIVCDCRHDLADTGAGRRAYAESHIPGARFVHLDEDLSAPKTGKNGRHRLAGLLRQSVFGRLAGYEDVNDADRLRCDPAMRWVVGDRAISESAASASQMGRFETRWLIPTA